MMPNAQLLKIRILQNKYNNTKQDEPFSSSTSDLHFDYCIHCRPCNRVDEENSEQTSSNFFYEQ